MRRAICIPLLAVMIGAAGCGVFGGRRSLTKQTRPISITLYQKNATSPCVAKFSNHAQHAFRNDDVAWEFTNTCTTDQTVKLSVKSGGSNPFTDPLPLTVSAIQNGDTTEKKLTISGSAAVGSYGFDITVGGVNYDPKLEIDP